MEKKLIFSWAENADGKIVHVDEVPRGLQCGCSCPHCHEKLMARHGDVREHGFAHHSDNRGANLEICYRVTLYKLAEQIVQTKKRIYAPSYYDIFHPKHIEFVSVKIDSSYEREDKQPDVIATTSEGKQFMIEFTFNDKVKHKQVIDYNNLTCLEIDLSNQTLESLEDFLLTTEDDRKWINNETYFNSIEERYAKANKKVRVVEVSECAICPISNNCCGVKKKDASPLLLKNNDIQYRICKPDEKELQIKKELRIKNEEEKRRKKEKEEDERQATSKRRHKEEQEQKEYLRRQQTKCEQRQHILDEQENSQDSSERSCFDCTANLSWRNRNDGIAHCGAYESMRVPRETPPSCARTCKNFKRKAK